MVRGGKTKPGRALPLLEAPWVLLLAAFLLASRSPAQGQQPGSDPQNQQGTVVEPQSQSQSGDRASAPAEDEPPSDSAIQGDSNAGQQTQTAPYQPLPTTNLDTGQSLGDLLSPLRWGRLSLFSVNMSYVYDTISGFSGTRVPPLGAAALQGLLVYSISKRNTGLDFQYRPTVLASRGSEQADLLGNSLSLHTYRNLTRQWVLDLSDTFSYVPGQESLLQQTFTPNFTTGQFTQQPLLATGVTYLTNNLSISATRVFSPKNRLTLSSTYTLQDLSIDKPTALQNSVFANVAQTFGAGISWSHSWSERREAGVTYNYAQGLFRNALPRTQYHSLMFFYQQRIRRSIQMQLNVGPSISVTNVAGGSTYKTVQGSFYLSKSFRISSLGLVLDRSQTFTGVISNGYSDRGDVYYDQRLGKRLTWTVGAGYIDQGLSPRGSLLGRVAQNQLSLRLSRGWSSFASYGYQQELGAARFFGTRQLILVGLRWSWNPEK